MAMPHFRELLRSVSAAEIKRLERLAAATHDNAERTTLMELIAAQHEILDRLAIDAASEAVKPA
jgi:hypothetical protein